MALTLRACLDEVDRLAREEGEHTLDEIGRDQIVDSVARAALLGARGNSGVILSQLVRGAAEELISRPGELVDPVLIGAGMARAAQRAYDSVRAPAEGTMLTVVRDMATAVASEVAHMAETRLAADAGPERQNRLIADVLARAVAAGEASLRRGPDLLPALRDAGVVDAGGYGVIVILAGVVAALRGDAAPAPAVAHHAPARVTHPEHASETFRWCTNFAVTGTDLLAPAFVPALEALGDSVLVVGDRTTLKVHVHTDDPARAIALFDGAGAVSRLDVADMRAQVAERDLRVAGARASTARAGALAGGSRGATGGWPAPALRRPGRGRSRSAPGRGWGRCSSRSARTCSTAARRSTPPRTSCSPASMPCRPSRWSSCRTARTCGWRPSAPPISPRRRSSSWRPARSRRGSRRRSRWRPSAAPPTTPRPWRTCSPRCGRVASPRPRGRTRAGASRSAMRSASSRTRSSRGARRSRRSRRCSRSWGRGPSSSRSSPAPAPRSPASGSRRSRRPGSSSSSPTAGRRAGGGCCPPSDRRSRRAAARLRHRRGARRRDPSRGAGALAA